MERSGAVRIMPTTVMTIRPMQSVSAVLTRGSRGFGGWSPSIVPGGGARLIPVRAHAAALGGTLARRLGQLGHTHDTVGLRHIDQPHPLRVPADLALVVRDLYAEQLVALLQRERDDPALARVAVRRELRLLDGTHPRRHDHIAVVAELLHGQGGGHLFVPGEGEEIDHRLALGGPA